MGSLFVKRKAEQRTAPQETALGEGKIGASMTRAQVVPHQEISRPPPMLIDHFRALREAEELPQQGITFLAGESLDPCRY